MKTITKAKQEQLHILYTSYKEQNLNNEDAIRYSLRDLKLPDDFCIDEYVIVEDKE